MELINESRKKRLKEESGHIVYHFGPDYDSVSYWYLIFKESETGDKNDEICIGSFRMSGVNRVKDILEHNGHTYEVTRTEYGNPSFIFGSNMLTDKTNVIWVK